MIISILLVAIGFVCLVFGANWLVEGASGLAKKYKVSDLVIGLTIVAFGTSAPELVVNIIASVKGYSDIVLGNLIGSNNFNLYIILGLAGLIMPIRVKSSTVWKEIPMSLLATVIVFLLLNNFSFKGQTHIGRIDGVIMLIMFLLFMYYVFIQMKNNPEHHEITITKSVYKITGLILLGFAGLIIGGEVVVANSVNIARQLGVSEKIIGLTIVALGTSLPELVTSVVAAIKKNSDLAIGNVIGSNIFNLLLVLGISSLIRPIAYSPKFNTDLLILIGGTMFLLLAMFTGHKRRLDRWEAAILFVTYLSYITFLVVKEL